MVDNVNNNDTGRAKIAKLVKASAGMFAVEVPLGNLTTWGAIPEKNAPKQKLAFNAKERAVKNKPSSLLPVANSCSSIVSDNIQSNTIKLPLSFHQTIVQYRNRLLLITSS